MMCSNPSADHGLLPLDAALPPAVAPAAAADRDRQRFRLRGRSGSAGFRVRLRVGLALAWLGVLIVPGCQPAGSRGKPTAAEADRLEELTAETLVLQEVDWPKEVRVQGTLYADEVAAIGARVAGRVNQVHVQLGDVVTAGQTLVSLDTAEFELMVAQAEAQWGQARASVGLAKEEGKPIDEWRDDLNPENSPPVRQQRAVWDEAKASLERSRRLLEQGAISPGEFGVIEAAARVAEAGYAAALNAVEEKISIIGVRRVEWELARQRLRDATITAPFDGLIQGRLVAPGGFIAAGDAVVTLVRTDPIWFRGLVPERYASKLTTGLPIRVRIEAIDQPVEAVVTRISPSLDVASRSLAFEARIENDDRRFRSGIFATADLVVDPQARTLAVPESAIAQFAGSEKVWKLVDGIAREAEISTGARHNGMAEVLEGLRVGDTILVDASIGRVARVVPASSSPARPIAGGEAEPSATEAGQDQRAAAPARAANRLVVVPAQ